MYLLNECVYTHKNYVRMFSELSVNVYWVHYGWSFGVKRIVTCNIIPLPWKMRENSENDFLFCTRIKYLLSVQLIPWNRKTTKNSFFDLSSLFINTYSYYQKTFNLPKLYFKSLPKDFIRCQPLCICTKQIYAQLNSCLLR